MAKKLVVLSAPVKSVSGYGEMARQMANYLLDYYPNDEVKILNTNWGHTPNSALDESNPSHKRILDAILLPPNQIARQPELFVQCTVPNEFAPLGKFNIGFTAGIETNCCSYPWIEGMNRMNANITISSHSKRVFDETIATVQTQAGTNVDVKITKPLYVLPVHVDTTVFHPKAPVPESISEMFIDIPEKFCYLFVGHWLKGGMREDRKNVALLIKIFCETFKNVSYINRPALVLKTSAAGFSLLERERILSNIREIRKSCGENVPNVYLIHGEMTPEELAGLYNHPKVKAHVSFTKGDGQAIPLLEGTMVGKPVISSGWSGPLDFLDPDKAILVGGELKPIEPGAVWENVLIAESQWFNIDETVASNALLAVFKNYENYLPKAQVLGKENSKLFNSQTIYQRFVDIMEQHKHEIPEPVVQPELVKLNLPKLKKIV